ncbi:MAG: PHB depolymerase family esterase [Thermoanaerobaculia bacterium]
MTLSSHDDLALRYVLNVPTGTPDSAEMPLVVILHGRGADANDLADLAPYIDTSTGCRFVFPNAPSPFEPVPGTTFGWTWFDGWPPVGRSFGESRELLLRFLDEIAERYRTPPGRIILGGFSQGALMSLDSGFRTNQPLCGIIAMSGALFEAEMAPLAPFRGRHVLLIHGLNDEVIPVAAGRRACQVLEENGLSPEYHEFPMGHQVTEQSMAVVKDFIARCMAPS